MTTLDKLLKEPINKDGIMNCKPAHGVSELPGSPEDYMLEPKFDGFRLILRRDNKGDVDIFTRNGKSQLGKLPWLEAIVKEFPRGTIVDGEIAAPYWDEDKQLYVQDFEQVQSVMLSKPDRSVEVAKETRDLSFYGFDLIAIDGDDNRETPLSARKSELGLLIGEFEDERFLTSISYLAEQRIHDQMCKQGFEGTVAKELDSTYASGKRGKGWYKLKKQTDVDVIILGYKPGTKALEGMVGGVIFGQIPYEGMDTRDMETMPIPHTHYEAVVRGSCSGFDLEERRHITEHWEDYEGTVMTIAHMGIMAGNVKMRHPQFKRFRPDKGWSECHWHDE